jgi:hypothetical protein
MKLILAVIVAMVIGGCSTLNYQWPDGSSVTYISIGRTDTLKAGNVELKGRTDVDPAAVAGFL